MGTCHGAFPQYTAGVLVAFSGIITRRHNVLELSIKYTTLADMGLFFEYSVYVLQGLGWSFRYTKPASADSGLPSVTSTFKMILGVEPPLVVLLTFVKGVVLPAVVVPPKPCFVFATLMLFVARKVVLNFTSCSMRLSVS